MSDSCKQTYAQLHFRLANAGKLIQTRIIDAQASAGKTNLITTSLPYEKLYRPNDKALK